MVRFTACSAFQLAAFVVTAVLFIPHPALAQRNLAIAPVTANEQRLALVIGNSAYKESPLRNPVNDATDVAKALSELGFRVTRLANASRRQMIEAVREFGGQLKRGGVGLFYFAGHGVQNKAGRNYLVPVGAAIESEADYEFEAMDANLVLAQMEEAGNRVNIVVLDACRDNPFGSRFRSLSRGLAQMQAAAGSFVAYATAPGSVAADGAGRNGLYTRYLLRSLRQADSKLEDVFKRVREGVAKETANRQIPWDSSSVIGDFYFRVSAGGAQVAAVAPSAVVAPADPWANERTFWESVKDSKNPEELRAYLDQFPNGLFAALAQARLKALQATQVATVAPSIAATRPAAAAGSIAAMSPGTVFRDCSECPEMVVIPAGSFMMGSPPGEPQRDSDEGPQHNVTIARPFAAGKYEVTFDEWDACVRESGCSHRPGDQGWGRGRRPAIYVSWQDAKQYVEWLSRKTARNYRLLTEAEWEYAARAGTTTAFTFGNSITPQQANYDTKVSYAGSPTAVDQSKTVPVGGYPPNAFGLYDVHGNVWEWTEDCWNGNYNGAPSDGSAWNSGDCGRRVVRGGSWGSGPGGLRSALRGWNPSGGRITFSGGGLRVARTE